MIEFVPFTEAHLPLFTAWFRALPGNEMWTEDWVRRRSLGDKAYDPELMITALDRGEPVGFALGSVSEQSGYVRAFVVHPERRRQRIGTALFDELERRFAQKGVNRITVGYALPHYFLPGVDIHYTPAIVFLYERDYETDRQTRVNMDVSLKGRDWSTDALEARLAARGFTVRRGRPSDRAALTQFCEREGHGTWAIESGMALENEPASVFIAEREGQLVAFAAHSISGPLQFGPMLTAPELRGLGLGTVLLKRCLRDWQQTGAEKCEIVWAGPLAFYARTVGATIGRAFWVFHKNLSTS